MTIPNSLSTSIDATYADDASDPSRKLHQQHHDALHALYDATVVDAGGGNGAIAAVVSVVHGATATVARPATTAVVHWIGSVAPNNKTTNDEWTDTANKVIRRWNGTAWDSLSAAGLVFDMRDYGVIADCKTLAAGAMTNGSAVLTDTTNAPFTAGDVGKKIVVNNAKGAGVHLYGTISSYTDASHVTLSTSATATVSGTAYSFGTDNTTNAQACLTAAQAVRGTVQLPPKPFLITSALTVTDGVTIQGSSVNLLAGHLTSNPITSGGIAAAVYPQDAPYLDGSVIVQAGANQNGLSITTTHGGRSVNLRNLGIFFAGQLASTGTGIMVDAPALSTYKDYGIASFKWDNLYVVGHDGTHYAAWLTNPLYGTIDHFQSYGGGGLVYEANHGTCYMGNMVATHVYVERLCGFNTPGIWAKMTTGVMNLCTFIRPQVIDGRGYLPSAFVTAYNLDSVAASPAIKDDGASYMTVIAADIEVGTLTGSFAGWSFLGTDLNLLPMPSGAPEANVMWAWRYGPNKASLPRRINKDGSTSLDIAESAGSTLNLLNDIPAGAKWAITTDGTKRMLLPGSFKATGAAPTVAAGAALGTSPPTVNINGSDLSSRIAFGSGTSPAAGALVTVTFTQAYAKAPNVLVTACNAATAALGPFYVATTTTTATIYSTVAPTAGQASGTYELSFMAIDAGGAAGPVLLVSDNFNKSDSTSAVGAPQVGPSPTVQGGTWGISSNRAYCSALASGDGVIAWDAGSADVTVQATLVTVTDVNTGIVVRSANATNFIIATGTQLFTRAGGTWTAIGSAYTAFADGDVMKVVTSGTSIKVFKNGTQVGSATSSYLQTTTTHGLRVSATTPRFDDLTITTP